MCRTAMTEGKVGPIKRETYEGPTELNSIHVFGFVIPDVKIVIQQDG
jgi:hypothetical protein